jgi:hypothetical protein
MKDTAICVATLANNTSVNTQVELQDFYQKKNH